jgi:hypothetical protein
MDFFPPFLKNFFFLPSLDSLLKFNSKIKSNKSHWKIYWKFLFLEKKKIIKKIKIKNVYKIEKLPLFYNNLFLLLKHIQKYNINAYNFNLKLNKFILCE